jgi:hypothetical protein
VLIGAHLDATNGSEVGQAYLFDASTSALLQTFDDPTPAPAGTQGDQFGSSVAIYGNNILIGAPRDDTGGPLVGQAHLFDATTGALLQTFDDPTPSPVGIPAAQQGADFFGAAVAMDGNYVLIGAWGDDTNGLNVGQAHLFDAVTGALLHTFDDPTPTDFDNGDLFGFSVAISGNNILIGAWADDTNGLQQGQAHLFDAITGALLHTFDDPTSLLGTAAFGEAVAIDGSNIFIGDKNDYTKGVLVGQAHLFTDVPAVPLPAALPLFGTGLGILGFIGCPSSDNLEQISV